MPFILLPPLGGIRGGASQRNLNIGKATWDYSGQKAKQSTIKELVVQKRLSGSRSVKELSDEFGISTWTIRQWLRNYQENETMADKEKRPRDWTAPERVEALIEASQLQAEERGSWCRSRGLHSHHLNSWKRDAIAGCSNPVAASRTKADRLLEKENKNLKRELNRKEKALAEVAALLVLKKKVDVLWGESEDD